MVSCWSNLNNGCKSDVLLVSKDSFLPYDGKPMVSWLRNSNLKHNVNRWFLNTRFHLRWKTDGFKTPRMAKCDELLVSKLVFILRKPIGFLPSFETTDVKECFWVSKDSFLPYVGKPMFLDEKLQFETRM